MSNFRSSVLFLILATPLASNQLDSNDKQNITNHFNAYIEGGSLPNVSILVKKDRFSTPDKNHSFVRLFNTICGMMMLDGLTRSSA